MLFVRRGEYDEFFEREVSIAVKCGGGGEVCGDGSCGEEFGELLYTIVSTA